MTDTEAPVFIRKEKKPKRVLDIPQCSEVEFDIIVFEERGLQIKKKILVEGTGKVPNKHATIRFLHQGRQLVVGQDNVVEEKIFDDSYVLNQQRKYVEDKCFPFYYACLMSMKLNEEAVFHIPNQLAFNNSSVLVASSDNKDGPSNVSNTNLYYWFKMAFLERNPMFPVDFEELLEFVELERTKANELYKRKEFTKARGGYNRSMSLLINPPQGIVFDCEEHYVPIREAKLKLHANITKSYDSEKDYAKCIEYATESLRGQFITIRSDMPRTQDPTLIIFMGDIMYVRGKARRIQERWDLGLEDMQHALDILGKATPVRESDKTKMKDLLEKINQEVAKLEIVRIRSEKQFNKSVSKGMKKALQEGIYDDAKAPTVEEAWREKEAADQKHGRKVWFGSDGQEFVVM